MYCNVICEGNIYFWTLDLSITQDVMEGGCEIYPPPAASELALPSDNSKHDCTGVKFILVPEYLTERDV